MAWTLVLKYQTGVVTPEKLEYIYYYLCRIIFQGVEDPERPVRGNP